MTEKQKRQAAAIVNRFVYGNTLQISPVTPITPSDVARTAGARKYMASDCSTNPLTGVTTQTFCDGGDCTRFLKLTVRGCIKQGTFGTIVGFSDGTYSLSKMMNAAGSVTKVAPSKTKPVFDVQGILNPKPSPSPTASTARRAWAGDECIRTAGGNSIVALYGHHNTGHAFQGYVIVKGGCPHNGQGYNVPASAFISTVEEAQAFAVKNNY